MDKLKISKKEFEELYEITEETSTIEKDTTHPTREITVEDKNMFITEEEEASDASLEEAVNW